MAGRRSNKVTQPSDALPATAFIDEHFLRRVQPWLRDGVQGEVHD